MPFDHQANGLSTPLIHIGFPKALSSWLQKFLFKPDHGYLNVLNSLCTQLSIIDPTPFSFSEIPAQKFMDDALQKFPQHQNLVPVCSAEALIGNFYCGGYNAKQNADRLKQVFPQAKILLIVREQNQLMRSLYKTLVVWGMPHTIKRLLHPHDTSMAPQFNMDFLRFDLATSYYQQLFGKDNVLVLPYEAFAENPKKFVEKIQQHAGIPHNPAFDKLPWHKRLNTNQTLANLYWQRLLNLILLSSPFNYAGLFHSTETDIHKRIARSKRNPLPRWTDHWFEDDFSQSVREAFHGQFGHSNARLQALTGLDLARYGYDVKTS
jgi:hypothetical protein